MPSTLSSVSAQALSPQLSRLSTVTMLRSTRVSALATMRAEVVGLQVEHAPTLTAAPASVVSPCAGADGLNYFVPSAVLAKRPPVNKVPHVFIARADGKYFLRVYFDLVRHAAIPADATPLALTDFVATLHAPGSNQSLQFTTCQDQPAPEGAEGVVKRIYCELEQKEPGVVTAILQQDAGAWFELTAFVHYRIATPPATDPGPVFEPAGPRVIRDHRRRAAILRPLAALRVPFAVEAVTTPAPAPAEPVVVAKPLSGLLSLDVMRNIELVWADLSAAPAPTSSPQQTRVLLSASNADVSASFPDNVPAYRPIYADVASSFGAIDPTATWYPTQWGLFTESPIPDQFYVLPDDYRLAFDVERGSPAMFVLLVPAAAAASAGDGAPAPTETAGAPATISSDYRLRCRFGIAPWFDSARLDALREEIAKQTGIVYPDLVIGGVEKATFGLSAIYESLGSEVLGDSADAPLEVDADGFELVLDSTNEFYNLLSRMLVTDGLEGEVELRLAGGGEEGSDSRLATCPVRLRLDQPALNFLSTRFEQDDGSDPEAPPRVVVTNPSNVAVTVGSIRAALLVMDGVAPSPMKAVPASASPASFTLDAASGTAARTELEITLTPEETLEGVPWGGVAVSFADVKATLDPEAVLARAHELGASTDLKSSVVVRSYQLEHPDTLPETHKDVFGLEVQLRRGEAEPVTIFVTRDQPQASVQVSFSLADIVAGANPEQPKFSWRRRNMAGSGTGDWSEWETIVGQQLFAAPVGL